VAKKPAKPVAKPSGYVKHLPPKVWNRKVVLGTKHGEARFMPGLPYSQAELDMLYLRDDAIALPDMPGTFWLKMSDIIGASEGELTQYILFQVNGGFSHSRPVAQSELREWGVKIR
jgi:hypothetical protein